MAGKRGQKAKAKQAASPKKSLTQIWKADDSKRTRVNSKSPENKKACDPGEIGKGEQSCFLSYLRCAAKGKCEQSRMEAENVLQDYKKATVHDKRCLIANFFRSGGRRAGLQSVYQQSVRSQEKASESDWTGYCTAGKILKMHEVHGV